MDVNITDRSVSMVGRMAPSVNASTAHPDHEVAIIGAGFSGIGAAIKVAREGINDFQLIEAGDGVGGAWHWNTYPGVAVDIPSPSYQFSFEQRSDWSRLYAPGDELKAYADDLTDKYDIRSRIRFNTKVTSATFDDDAHFWRLGTEDGDEITARFVIGATGVFNEPRIPDIAGVGDFEGEMIHTARWDHDISLEGKRVGIIGTGASAVQVIPAIAPRSSTSRSFSAPPSGAYPSPTARWAERLLGACKSSPAGCSSTGSQARSSSSSCSRPPFISTSSSPSRPSASGPGASS